MICARCKEELGPNRPGPRNCWNCGMSTDRVVRNPKRRSKIGGKRGRNSGTTGSAKNK